MKMRRLAPLALVMSAVLITGCATKRTQGDMATGAAGQSPELTLPEGALFAFARSSLEDMAPEGRRQLDALAARLQDTPYTAVRVIGHSDRIGNDLANQRLSEDRARTVLDYLVQAGVPADKITSSGRGSAEPVLQCDGDQGEALKACLAPNRRVEVMVDR